MVMPQPPGTSRCYVYYHPQGNLLYLRNDADTAWLMPGLTPGGTGTLANSQCTLYANSSVESASGNNLTLSVSLTFSGTFVGPRNVELYAAGQSGLNSGWVDMGTWTAVPSTGPPTIVSVTLNPATGLSVVFTAVYSDPNGAADLNEVELLVNTKLLSAGACYVYYDPLTNKLDLYNDAGTALLTPALTPGGSGTLTNSQCTLNASSSTVSESGNNLTLNVSLTFTMGAGDVFLYASSGLTGQKSGWALAGTWTP
jgi:hypothetical protein